jgi:hypothetical protein
MFHYLKLLLFEKWKDVVEYKGCYQISNFGRVRSLDRNEINVNGISRKLKGSLKNSFISGGYVLVTLSKNNTNKSYTIHRLMAEAFIPNPNNLDEVNHKDRKRKNNFLSNLEWCTSRENTHHARIRMKSSSKYVGVSYDKYNFQRPWVSRINLNGKPKFLGRHETEELAFNAYKLECEINNIKINTL